jgi:hypothetical protein
LKEIDASHSPFDATVRRLDSIDDALRFRLTAALDADRVGHCRLPKIDSSHEANDSVHSAPTIRIYRSSIVDRKIPQIGRQRAIVDTKPCTEWILIFFAKHRFVGRLTRSSATAFRQCRTASCHAIQNAARRKRSIQTRRRTRGRRRRLRRRPHFVSANLATVLAPTTNNCAHANRQ